MATEEGTSTPTRNPVFMTLEPHHLTALTANIAKAITSNQTPRTSTSKDLKFSEQATFTGKPEDLEPMLREAEIRFTVQAEVYDTPTKRAYYILSLFKSGNAKLWKEQYIRKRENKTLCPGDTWLNFKRELKESFRDIGSAEDAMEKLQKIRQGRDSVDDLNTKFRILVQIASLDEQLNAALLIQMYQKAINPEIGRQIILAGAPLVLADWMAKASELDSFQRRANHLFAGAISKSRHGSYKAPWKPKISHRDNNYQGEPMDIDRLDVREEQRRKDQNLCFNCGTPGHMSRDCRKPRQNQGGPSNQQNNGSPRNQQRPKTFQGNKTQGKRPPNPNKKKMNPTALRHHIRALLTENLGEETEEFEEFVKQVEEQGF